MEDINAQFGEAVAIHYFGATEEEKQEFEDAVVQDEKVDQTHEIGREDLTKVVAGNTHVEVMPIEKV